MTPNLPDLPSQRGERTITILTAHGREAVEIHKSKDRTRIILALIAGVGVIASAVIGAAFGLPP